MAEDAVPTSTHLKEKDIRAGLERGGIIRGCFLIARLMSYGYEFMPYIRPSWKKGHLPLYTYLGKEVRTYRDVGRFIKLVRDDYGFLGAIQIYFPRTADLARFRHLLPEDAPPEGTIPSLGAAED